ncbi:PadR family transcriptional regulator [Lactobacillus sp. Sy-1]|uniref:PadR family transcriptional regulator n=1 Tax=Lactobacillus sp. Sy-1 TaxID=2109645 RepID=UPI001C5BB6C5|nr:PadR family transcriptional regulator [Lactobacillus sp. Sy-1]MBW1606266.1 PadR family transcriptional regulator [Lactobacillus sp. Sy-1]
MAIKISSDLLDGCVLGLLDNEDYYGYEITKRVQKSISVSNSTMYPVMRRLKKDGLVTTYDQPYKGRNRRYYKITDSGIEHLKQIRSDWNEFKTGINNLMGSEEIE